MGDLRVLKLAVDPGDPTHVLAGTDASLWEITVDPDLVTCDPPDLEVHFPSGSDPESFTDGCSVQLNGSIAPAGPSCPDIDRIHWQWGDGSTSDGSFPASHVYPRNGGAATVTAIGYDASGNYSLATSELNLWDCLTLGPCGHPVTRTLSGLTFDSMETIPACESIYAGPDLEVVAPGGDVTLRAGERVAFGDGFSVGSGARLTVEIDPTLSP